MPKSSAKSNRVAIIDGCRTPFARAWTHFIDQSALDLAIMATNELIERTDLPPDAVDEVVMGCVIPPANAPNIAREVVIALGLPARIPGFTLNRACASSIQALSSAAESILAGTNQVVLAGGAESLSSVPVPYSRRVIHSLLELRKAKSLQGRLAALRSIKLKDLVPKNPDLTEISTGLTMGQHAEDMARKNGVSREDQDKFAYESHLKASTAISEGRFNGQVIPCYPPPRMRPVTEDNVVRKNPDLYAMATLPPVFDRRYGTITAANSSGLTDGAAVVLLMAEEKARALGYKPKGYIKSWAFASLDPQDQLLLGPVYASPLALDRAGLKLSDMDVVEMHEAFAAQVLSCTRAMASKQFAQDRLGRMEAVGEIDPAKFNPMGGSIAVGHPFGATGARMVTQALSHLHRTGGQHALVTLCAAGAMGTAMVLEKE
ncbi:MAG: acetyl-CoA C-acyltransferase FadI [Candidatus Xenobia bacterium]